MIERLHFHRGYSLRLHKSKPFINYGIIRYGIGLLRVQRQNRREGYREDIRMLSAVLREERPAVRERPALSSADSIA